MKIRCLVKRSGDLYVAISLEFGLAAQANTLAEVKTKLESQISEYIEDLNEEKDDFQKQYLLNRKGPWRWFLFYYVARLLNKVHLNASKVVEVISFQDVDGTIKHA